MRLTVGARLRLQVHVSAEMRAGVAQYVQPSEVVA